MSLYQIYLYERYRLLYKSVVMLVIGTSALLVCEGYYHVPLVVLFIGLSYMITSHIINNEVQNARKVLFANLTRSHYRMIGIRRFGNYFFVSTDGWVMKKIKRVAINKFKLYHSGNHKQPCIKIKKTTSTISFENGKDKYRFKLTSRGRNSIKWKSCGNLEDTVSLTKNKEKWTISYNNVERITFTNREMPLSFQKLFDCRHTLISFHEAYDSSLAWLLVFVWVLQTEYFFSS